MTLDTLRSEETLEQYAVLTEEDQAWLASFGVDGAWVDDETLRAELDGLVAVGNSHIMRTTDPAVRDVVLEARESFLAYIGVNEKSIDEFRKDTPTLVSPTKFIEAQRVLHANGLNGAKILKNRPEVFSYSAGSLQTKIDFIAALGINQTQAIKRSPSILTRSEEGIQGCVDALKELGFDVPKLVKSYPNTLSLSAGAIRDAHTFFSQRGLDANAVIQNYPSVLAYSDKTLEVKMRFIERSASLLRWNYSHVDLINASPNILGFSLEKLKIMRSIAAAALTEEDRLLEPKTMKHALRKSIDNYIVALGELGADQVGYRALIARARSEQYPPDFDRRQAAIDTAQSGKIGRIGTMYLAYIGESAQE